MSLMDTFKRFAQPYADDEEYEDEDEGYTEFESEEEPVAERSPRPRRTPNFGASRAADPAPAVERPAPAASAPASTGFSGQVVNLGGSKQEVVLFRPSSFSDTSKAADDLRARKAVIVNMENVDKAMSRRVVDFLSGCAYAVDGKVKKIAQSTYLFCPHHMDVQGELENVPSEAESYV